MIKLAACLAWPAPVETPTMRATGIGTHPTNEDGEKNRCATALHGASGRAAICGGWRRWGP